MSHGTVLRAVLQKIFRNRDILYVDDNTGDSFRVDALSGTQEEYNDGGGGRQHQGGGMTDHPIEVQRGRMVEGGEPPSSGQLNGQHRFSQEAAAARLNYPPGHDESSPHLSHRNDEYQQQLNLSSGSVPVISTTAPPHPQDDMQAFDRIAQQRGQRVTIPRVSHSSSDSHLETAAPPREYARSLDIPPAATTTVSATAAAPPLAGVRLPTQSSPGLVHRLTHQQGNGGGTTRRSLDIPPTRLPPPVFQRRDNADAEVQRAISESQATHIAHTRRQVDHDIQFRRALEVAAQESAMMMATTTATDGEEGDDDEVQLLKMASQRSIIDEQNRLRESQNKYELELELALKQSEHLNTLMSEEEMRLREGEDEMIQDLLLKSRAEEEEARRLEEEREEELVKKALEKSVDPDCANVDEDELVEEAIRKSVCDSEEDDRKESAEEVLKRVMRLSLEEKDRIAREEEEELRKAMEWSMLESVAWDGA